MACPLALQLHTVRDALAEDLPGVLAQLRAFGYRGVESADLHGRSPEAFRSCVDDAGLTLTSAHAMAVGDGAAAALDGAAALGVSEVVVPVAGPERFASRDAVLALADELAASAALAAERGLALGYHNHFWEWTPLADGELAYDLLADALPEACFLELDLYWARTAGQDPVGVLRRHGEKIRLLHVKDGPADDPGSAMTAVGDGVVPIADALAAAPAARWHIVELDRCDTDMLDAVARSARWLLDGGHSEGAAGDRA